MVSALIIVSNRPWNNFVVWTRHCHPCPRASFRNRRGRGLLHGQQTLCMNQKWDSLTKAPNTAKISLRTGLYISVAGVLLICAPQFCLKTLLLIASSDVPSAGWSRVGGVLCILFGSYYIGCAWDDAEGRFPRRFYQSTVIGRLFLCFAFLGLVLVGQLPKGLMILAAVNALSAWSLHRAMVSRVRDA